MANINMIQSIQKTLDRALEKDDKVLLFGEDVGVNGGVFRASDGLQKKYGVERVFDTPVSEAAILGMSLGLTVEGYKPIAEIEFSPFMYEAIDGLAAQIAKNRFRFSGTKNTPITIRAPFGGGVGAFELHSDSLEAIYTSIPGLRVVIPSGPKEAKGLLNASIKSNDPVLFLEHLKLYRAVKEEVPDEDYDIDITKANIVKEGKDITVIAYGLMVREAMKAIEELEKENISVELIDLRTVSPIDYTTIKKSVEKTGSVVIVQEAQRMGGVGSKIALELANKCIYSLETSIGFVSAPDSAYPFAAGESEWLPNAKDIVKEVKKIYNEK